MSLSADGGDGGPQPGPDADASVVVPDSGDAGADTGPDGSLDAGLKIDMFSDEVANKVCRSLARCCYGNADLDGGGAVDGGGTYDRTKCLAFYSTLGFESSNIGASAVFAGNVELDQQKAADCLAKADALTCNLTGAGLQAARAACFGAFKGKLANGAGCRASIECGTGSFCNAPDRGDGGAIVGTCQPLRGAAGVCGDFSALGEVAGEACSYRNSGVPGLHCNTIDFVTVTEKPRAQWSCAANVPNGSDCADSNWCSAGVCNANVLKCQSPVDYFELACPFFVKP